MKIQAINHYPAFKSVTEEHRKPPVDTPMPVTHPKHKTNPVKLTGWIGAGALAVSVVSGIAHKNLIHKISAFSAIGAIAGHIGLLNAHHHKHHEGI